MTRKISQIGWLIAAVVLTVCVPRVAKAEVKPIEPELLGGDYQIKTKENLYWFANEVNNGNVSISAKLIADIVVNENLLTDKIDNDGNVQSGKTVDSWILIGYYKSASDCKKFTGTFDGQGHTISGLYFNDSNQMCVGLFGYIGNSGFVKNVGVKDSYFKGKQLIGGVCGENEGALSNCYSIANVSGTYDIGGICGYNNGTINNCYNTGNISGAVNDVGGVCGQNCSAKISNCYNTGNVSGKSLVGGVCGLNNKTTDIPIIENCYYLKAEGLSKGVGHNGSGTVTNVEEKTAEEFTSGSVAWLLNENATDGSTTPENTTPWLQNIGVDASPVLKANTANDVCPVVVKYGDDYRNDNSHSYSELATNADAGIHNLYSYHCTKCNADNKKVIKDLTKDGDDDIEIIKNGTEPWKTSSLINLTAATYYDAPVEFVTTGGVTFKFTRTADVKWATLCLPYKITTRDYTAKCKFYKLNSVGENEIVLGELFGEIVAGTPVFVKSDNDFDVDFSITANTEVEMTTAPKDQSATDGTLIGTFKEKELTTGANANDLFIKENYMWRVGKVNKTMKVRPFRAYIEASSASGGAPAPKLSIVVDGEATAISDALDTLNDTNAEYYDMSGRRISSLQKGVNIIRSGNKTRKVIIK